MLLVKKFWGQKIFESKIFGSKKKFFGQKNFWGQKIFESKKFWINYFGQKVFLVNKKRFWSKKTFLVKKSFGSKNIWFKKNFALKNFFALKIFGSKNIWFTRFVSDFFLSKKTGRVNPSGWIYDTPPENSRVKFVLGCSQFCFVRSPTKFQTYRIILSGRSRVPVGWGGWWVVV